MAYTNSTNDRMDELRFRSQQSPLGVVSPPRGTRIQPLNSQENGRGGLTRRFTEGAGRVPTIQSLASQRAGQDSQEYGPSVSLFLVCYTTSSYCPQPQLRLNYFHLSPIICIGESLSKHNTDLPFADLPQGPTCKNSSLPPSSHTSRNNVNPIP